MSRPAGGAAPPADFELRPSDPDEGLALIARPQDQPDGWKAVHRAVRHAAIKATEAGTPLSLVILQIEGTQRIDRADVPRLQTQLIQAAQAIGADTDPTGLPWLYGTDRFVFILTETRFAAALGKIDQLRACIGPTDARGDAADLEVSVGVAEYTSKESLGHFIQRAIDAVVRDDGQGWTGPDPH